MRWPEWDTDARKTWTPALRRVHQLHPDDLEHYRPPELNAVIQDADNHAKLEKLQAETMIRLSQWLEAQGG